MSIRHLDFHVTNKCNLLCKHCLYSSGEKIMDELNLHEIKRVLIDFLEISDNKGSVNLFGGEPLLREDIYKIIEFSKELGLDVGITTNVNFKQSTIEKLKKFENLLIKVDLDGGTEQTHDWLRNKNGHFGNTIKAIKDYRMAGLMVNITAVLHKKNVDELEQMLNMCSELNVNAIMFFYFTPLGRGSEIGHLQMEAHDWISARNRVITWISQNSPSFDIVWEDSYYMVCPQINSNSYYKICDKLHNSINIMSDGSVHYCGLLASVNAEPLGNIKKDSLKTIIERTKYLNYKDFKGCPALAIQNRNIKGIQKLEDPRSAETNIVPACSYVCELLNSTNKQNSTDTFM